MGKEILPSVAGDSTINYADCESNYRAKNLDSNVHCKKIVLTGVCRLAKVKQEVHLVVYIS